MAPVARELEPPDGLTCRLRTAAETDDGVVSNYLIRLHCAVDVCGDRRQSVMEEAYARAIAEHNGGLMPIE